MSLKDKVMIKNIITLCLIVTLSGCVTNRRNMFVFSLGDTGSMIPALSHNDIIYLDEDFPYNKLRVGDVVAYYDDSWGINNGFLHRIYHLSKNEPREWLIRGDNNESIDQYNLTKDNYWGKVVRVDFN